MHVAYHISIRCELRVGGTVTPSNKDVPGIIQNLHISLRRRLQDLRMVVRNFQLRGSGFVIEMDAHSPTRRLRILVGMRCVIKKSYGVVITPARVVLPAEICRGPIGQVCEVVCFPTQRPENCAGTSIDITHGMGMSSRYEVVALCIFVYAVDVIIIKRCILLVALCVESLVCYVDKKMVRSAPLEEQFPCRDVNLLEESVVEPAQCWATDGCQIGRDRFVDGYQRSSIICQGEFVKIAAVKIANGPDFVTLGIGRIQLKRLAR